MVTPTPTARPFTAATSGVLARARAASSGLPPRRASLAFASPALTAAKSARSLPAVNMSPLAWIRMQRTSLSKAAWSMASPSDWYMARVSAFFLSGRFMVSVSTPPDFSMRM